MAPKAAPAVPATKLRLVTSSCLMSASREDAVCQKLGSFGPGRGTTLRIKTGQPGPLPLRQRVPAILEALADFGHRVRASVIEQDIRRDIVLLAALEMKDLLVRSVTFSVPSMKKTHVDK
jgi:hypothetical protein